MADKKHIIRSQGNIDLTGTSVNQIGDTIITSTNELRVNDDQIIINADQTYNSSTLVFRKNGSGDGSIAWDGAAHTVSGNFVATGDYETDSGSFATRIDSAGGGGGST